MMLLFITTGLTQAQTVSGVVVSADDNDALPGITVLLQGTNKGTSTNLDGEYELELSTNEFQNGILIFSAIGFVRQEIAVDGQSSINVELVTDTQLLDDVVVVGYGAIVREEMTGNVASISSRQIEEVPVNSFESAIQGQASGVFIQKSNGKLGQGINIRVRGTSSVSASSQPLYVIDGIPTTSESQSQIADTNPLSDLDMDNIESIEILKDAAAAAIYGSRGANGVILVTTKRGQAGDTRINVSLDRGVSAPTNRVEF
ncbi:MAG: TonB-dependent receptor plug domain-containing protein, partial [Balneolaceae bacterium]